MRLPLGRAPPSAPLQCTSVERLDPTPVRCTAIRVLCLRDLHEPFALLFPPFFHVEVVPGEDGFAARKAALHQWPDALSEACLERLEPSDSTYEDGRDEVIGREAVRPLDDLGEDRGACDAEERGEGACALGLVQVPERDPDYERHGTAADRGGVTVEVEGIGHTSGYTRQGFEGTPIVKTA